MVINQELNGWFNLEIGTRHDNPVFITLLERIVEPVKSPETEDIITVHDTAVKDNFSLLITLMCLQHALRRLADKTGSPIYQQRRVYGLRINTDKTKVMIA